MAVQELLAVAMIDVISHLAYQQKCKSWVTGNTHHTWLVFSKCMTFGLTTDVKTRK